MKIFFQKHKKLSIVIIAVLILAIAGGIALAGIRSKLSAAESNGILFEAAACRNIERSISGSSALKPANSYTVSGRYAGEITGDYAQEGDTVIKGQELYVIDSSDSDKDDDSLITAPCSGYVSSLSIRKGDTVRMSQAVAEIVDDSQLKLTLNFSDIDAANFYRGQSASIILDSTFEELQGTVDSVAMMSSLGPDNLRVREVVILVDNPGTLDSSYLATASIGNAVSINPANFAYTSSRTVTSDISGTVYRIYAEKGSRVNQGSLIASLEESEDLLHSITSPIDGTIIDKAYKQGENVEAGRTLCTIYDLSYLEMTLSVDELDIADIQVGQEVKITADAREGKEFKGYVSKVSIAGTNVNGTATYPVTIRIDEYGSLLPSMSADAVIYVATEENVLAVPSLAIQRGNEVLITKDSPTAKKLAEQGVSANENGFFSVPVEIGISDDNYTQIKSGLAEGDTVAYTRNTSNGFLSMFGIKGGGMNIPGMGGF